MSRKTDAVVACTIGIDAGKNTLHLVGLDDRGAIVLRSLQMERAALPQWLCGRCAATQVS